MKIAEILDRKVEYTVEIDNDLQFQTKARIGDRIIVFDADTEAGEDVWGIVFWQTTLEGKSMRFEITKGGNELEVFSMVRDSMNQFIEKHKPATIKFSADKSRGATARTNLYDRLLKRFKIPGYTHEKRSGNLDDYFILTRQK